VASQAAEINVNPQPAAIGQKHKNAEALSQQRPFSAACLAILYQNHDLIEIPKK
jgi:hypothetical protein